MKHSIYVLNRQIGIVIFVEPAEVAYGIEMDTATEKQQSEKGKNEKKHEMRKGQSNERIGRFHIIGGGDW